MKFFKVLVLSVLWINILYAQEKLDVTLKQMVQKLERVGDTELSRMKLVDGINSENIVDAVKSWLEIDNKTYQNLKTNVRIAFLNLEYDRVLCEYSPTSVMLKKTIGNGIPLLGLIDTIKKGYDNGVEGTLDPTWDLSAYSQKMKLDDRRFYFPSKAEYQNKLEKFNDLLHSQDKLMKIITVYKGKDESTTIPLIGFEKQAKKLMDNTIALHTDYVSKNIIYPALLEVERLICLSAMSSVIGNDSEMMKKASDILNGIDKNLLEESSYETQSKYSDVRNFFIKIADSEEARNLQNLDLADGASSWKQKQLTSENMQGSITIQYVKKEKTPEVDKKKKQIEETYIRGYLEEPIVITNKYGDEEEMEEGTYIVYIENNNTIKKPTEYQGVILKQAPKLSVSKKNREIVIQPSILKRNDHYYMWKLVIDSNADIESIKLNHTDWTVTMKKINAYETVGRKLKEKDIGKTFTLLINGKDFNEKYICKVNSLDEVTCQEDKGVDF